MNIQDLNEHAGTIILILAAFSIWAGKRILGKMEKSIDDLEKLLSKHQEADEVIHKDLYDKNISQESRLSKLIGEHEATHKGGK